MEIVTLQTYTDTLPAVGRSGDVSDQETSDTDTEKPPAVVERPKRAPRVISQAPLPQKRKKWSQDSHTTTSSQDTDNGYDYDAYTMDIEPEEGVAEGEQGAVETVQGVAKVKKTAEANKKTETNQINRYNQA